MEPITAQRRVGLRPEHKSHFPDTAARIAQRFAPRVQTVAAFGDQRVDQQTSAIPSSITVGFRHLLAVVILIAWLPGLVIGATLWLSRSALLESPPRLAKPTILAGTAPERLRPGQATEILPVLTMPATLEAKAGEEVDFPITLDGTDGVPPRSMIAISGLPQGTTFSNGRPYGETEWTLKSDEIGDLHLLLPNTARGESKIRIQLIAADGDVVADAETILRVAVDAQGVPVMWPPESELPSQAQDFGTKGADSKVSDQGAAPVTTGDPAKRQSSGLAQTASDDVHAEWIVLLDFVNLRGRPSSSAPVIGQMPKGAKLRALGRKHGWVQVSNPVTSVTGWIYARNTTASTSRRASKRRVHSKVRSESNDSLWTSLGQWLAGP